MTQAGTTMMGGSAAAAFVAGMIAFFAPCCSGVMMPTYLAAISGGNRIRTARLTAVYVAGVAAIVWPITLGAGAIGEWTSRYHPQLFVLGGLMMLFTAVTAAADELRQREITLVSVTNDDEATLAEAAPGYGITTPLLADPTKELTARFGAMVNGMHGVGADHMFIYVDRSGSIRFMQDYPSMWIEPQALLKQLAAV